MGGKFLIEHSGVRKVERKNKKDTCKTKVLDDIWFRLGFGLILFIQVFGVVSFGVEVGSLPRSSVPFAARNKVNTS